MSSTTLPGNLRRLSTTPYSSESTPPSAAPVNVMRRGTVDLQLLTVTLLLLAFGVVMVYSASAVFAARAHHSAQYYLVRQSVFALIGLGGLVAASSVDYRLLRKFTYPLLGTTVLLLVLVIVGFG
ncbi:MAG: FtsW/RodA/SpoVE family cell cycle protein, partial [Deltaproteobacteria bacterium]